MNVYTLGVNPSATIILLTFSMEVSSYRKEFAPFGRMGLLSRAMIVLGNLQYQGVHLIWITVGQLNALLAVGASGVVWIFFLSSV